MTADGDVARWAWETHRALHYETCGPAVLPGYDPDPMACACLTAQPDTVREVVAQGASDAGGWDEEAAGR